MERKGIEFWFVDDWKEWDEIDTGTLYFYDCTFKSDLPKPIKENCTDMCISMNTSVISFYKSDGSLFIEYELKATLWKKINS